VVLHRPDGSAVDECLVNGEIQPVIRTLHARPVERALAGLGRDTAAARAPGGWPVRALLEEEEFDALVGGRLERLLPPGGSPPVAPHLLSPALENRSLLLDAPALEHRSGQLEQLRRLGMGLRMRPADDRRLGFLGEQIVELGASLFRGEDHDLGMMKLPDEPIELIRNLTQVLLDELLDVALVARLRPAALIVLPRLVLGVVRDFLESTGMQAVELAALSSHDDDQRAFPTTDEGNERREIELPPHLGVVRDRLGQRKRPPHVVEPGAEDRQSMSAVARELALVVLADAIEVGPEADSLVVSELAAVRPVSPARLIEKRVEAGRGVGRRRRKTRIEIEIEAHGAALLGLESGEIAEFVPGDRSRQGLPRSFSERLATYTIGTTGRRMAFTTSEEPETGGEVVSTNEVREIIVIGGGPAAYTAALYSARANLNPLVIEGFAWGGQLMITSDVENYPGYADGVLGPEMMQDLRRQAERFGTEFLTDDVTKVDFSERPFRVWVGDDEYRAEAIVVSTGANARQLGLESEKRLQGRGVSYCAVCDAAFFKEKEIVVVGGGDSAMEEATFLAKFASKVTVIHRRESFRASPIMVDRARSNDKIEFVLDSVVEEVLGEETVTGVVVRNLKTNERTELPADGFFVAIGHDPSTALFRGQLEMDEAGYIETNGKTTETNVDGVFAAGDVQDHVYRQAVTAAGSGCMAALDAERFLSAQEGRPEAALAAPRS
jgi:thioredoxin reductase (NADPH)